MLENCNFQGAQPLFAFTVIILDLRRISKILLQKKLLVSDLLTLFVLVTTSGEEKVETKVVCELMLEERQTNGPPP